MSTSQQTVGETRRERVARACTTWAQELIDLGWRNPLLYYRDLKTSTLDLSGAPDAILERLFGGEPIRVSSLAGADAADAGAAARMIRSAAALARRVLVLDEEQGVDAGRVAVGFVRAERPGPASRASSRASSDLLPLDAPLLLWRMQLRAVGSSQADFALRLSDDGCEPNPVLLYAMEQETGQDRTALMDRLTELITTSDVAVPPMELAARCLSLLESELQDSRLSLTLQRRIVAGTFSYEKMPMVEDLAGNVDLLATSDVIAALAGEPEALRSMAGGQESGLPRTDDIPPAAEFLVRDADSSQQAAIEAALAGRNLVIDGPPGTGKSQTIANLIAGLAARGKRVLFVAEKRAAIEAVTVGLAKAGLERLVFDLHESTIDTRRLAQRLQQDLEQAGATTSPPIGRLHDRLDMTRGRLLAYHQELHRPREPWEMSAYEVQTEIAGLPEDARTRRRLAQHVLARLDARQRELLESALRDFVAEGGLRFLAGRSPWSGSPIRNSDDASAVAEHLAELSGGALTTAWRNLDAMLATARLQRPEKYADWEAFLAFLAGVSASVTRMGPEVFGPDLHDLVWATGDGAWRRAHPQSLGLWARWRLVRRARAMPVSGRVDRRTAHAALLAAADQHARWSHYSIDNSGPSAVPRLAETMTAFENLTRRLAAIAAALAVSDWEERSRDDIDGWLEALDRAREDLRFVPRWNALADQLNDYGLAAFLQDLVHEAAGVDPAAAALRFRSLWLHSVQDVIWMQSPVLGAFSGPGHSQAVETFQRDDRDHLRLNAARVRRRVAEKLKQARDTHPDEDRLIREQAARRARHLPTRQLVAGAPHVLFSLYPCWAMSPLVVSRLLPAERLFDVVIFDEASQIEPENAIPSIMRAHQVVVAGDDQQLPPTSFFRTLRLGEDPADDESALRDYESLLTRMEGLLGSGRRHRLQWHYRSLDERLISFANVEIYSEGLVTFPSASVDTPVTLELVDGVATPGQDGSAPQEVAKVVELVLQHAAAQSGQPQPATLGVITMGVKHAARVEAAVKQALRERPELSSFFDENQGPGRRFFVKSIEQVQGDERDHIILSVGYAKTPSGRVPSTFGPLNQEHGHRRLNVAVTRARRSMTVVSSFRHIDMDVDRAAHRGPVLLRKFLEFAERGGDADALSGPTQGVKLNPFEEQVLAAMQNRGLPVQPQWGVGGYRIDFALAHPDRPGEFVLAVEADGRTYHSSASARDRDRLRQEHLERLGWRFHRLWSTAWFRDPQAETDVIVARWRQACEEAGEGRRSGAVITPSDREDTRATPQESHETSRPDRPGPRPPIPGRRRIDEYSDEELDDLCRWLLSDGLPLTREDRVTEAIRELRFTKRGSRIVQRITEALERAQRSVAEEGA